jgi:RNA-directed DNA polymerase
MWMMRMLEALVNGVKEGKWFSLIDKVYRSETLRLAWNAMRRNANAA